MSSTMTHSSPSPVHSLHRRLSHRRGSVSAPDPYGLHAETNLDPSRSCASTLTIVRLAPVEPTPQFTSSTSLKLNDPPLAHRRSLHRGGRGGPGGSSSSNHGGNSESPRLSFAFNSFAGTGLAPGGPSSPSGSRPSSPTMTRSNSGGAGGRPSSPTFSRPGRTPGPHPRLPPEQLVELAKQSTSPHVSSSAAGTPASSPSLHRPHSPRASFGVDEHHVPAPAKFTPMAFDVYLPFLDRPAEVLSLISSPPSAKLFSLLKQTFPVSQAASEGNSTSSAPGLIEAPASPAEWTYDQLHAWLTTIPREEADDRAWVRAARICIRAHSELIWERVKGALGVPPELDCDEEEDEFEDPFLTDEEEDPVLLPPAALATADKEHNEEAVPVPTVAAAQGDASSPLADGAGLAESSRISLDDGPAAGLSLEDAISIEPIFASATGEDGGVLSPSGSSAPPPLSLPPSLGDASAASLGFIGEEDEEEEDNDNGETSSAKPSATATEKQVEEEEREVRGLKICTVPAPTSSYAGSVGGGGGSVTGSPLALRPRSYSHGQGHGGHVYAQGHSPSPLRGGGPHGAVVSPLGTPTSGLASPPPPSSSPMSGFRSTSTNSFVSAWVAANSAENTPRPGVPVPGSRKGEAADYGFVGSHLRQSSLGGSSVGAPSSEGGASAGGAAAAAGAYDPVGDRSPGNPLFPSNFARLALAPTLRANNPNLRNSLQNKFKGGRSYSGSHVRRPLSWLAGHRGELSGNHEYAVTIASSSSVGGPE